MRSTLWSAEEVNRQQLDKLVGAIRTAQKDKLVYDESEEYSYIIQSVEECEGGVVGTLYKCQ